MQSIQLHNQTYNSHKDVTDILKEYPLPLALIRCITDQILDKQITVIEPLINKQINGTNMDLLQTGQRKEVFFMAK